jgi:ankyrin repeat protein
MNRINRELIVAARENNVPDVRRLLRAGADVNARNNNGWMPLHEACRKGHVHVVIELLEHGTHIDVKGSGGWTPLHLACRNGHVAVVNELLSRGANIEATTNIGNTPLHCTSWNFRYSTIVKALLSGGANVLAANNEGQLPMHQAVEKGNSEVAKCLLQHFYATTRRLPLHELLEDFTWIGNPYMSNGAPPLREALHHNVLGTDDVVEIIEYMVDRNPELLSSRDQDGSLPLHVACRRGASFPIVQSLVDLYQASVKSVTPGGDLPLFLACDIPEPSLDTIFMLVKLYPDLVYR